jgi:anaerobic selenocysteine-containing dehydrogenase
MTTTRRDLFKFAGGAALGALLTPAPWRLITDTALWSENWPGIPRPARGEMRTKFTNCTLCPAGCAVQARCVGEQPVSLAGVAGHPLSHGALCAFGIAGHHLPYHPARLRSGAVQEAAAAVAQAMAGRGARGRVVVFDPRPGRTASWTYRRAMAAIPGGTYVRPAPALGGNAVNLAAARTVLSFGVPVMDGWGTPGNVMAAREGFRLIQVEAVESRTAAMADVWLPVRAGQERAMAAAMGGAPGTGIADEQVRQVAQELAENGPAVVLGLEDWPEIVALNRRCGAAGRTIVARRGTPVPEAWKKSAPETEWSAVEDGSVRVLLIDEAAAGDTVPWSAIQPKLARGALVVAFACTREGYARHANYTLPTAVYPEMVDDIPAAVDSPASVFRMSASLVAAPEGMVNPAEFVARLGGIDGGAALRERADAIHRTGRGSVFAAGQASRTAREMKPDEFRKALTEGACWIDEPDPKAKPPVLVAASAGYASSVALTEQRGAGLVSPLLSKLHEESRLRLARHEVALHPSSGFRDGERAALETGRGRIEVVVTLDSSVPPGVVQAAAGADVVDLCGGDADARVVRI